jgi:hypothetical protein
MVSLRALDVRFSNKPHHFICRRTKKPQPQNHILRAYKAASAGDAIFDPRNHSTSTKVAQCDGIARSGNGLDPVRAMVRKSQNSPSRKMNVQKVGKLTQDQLSGAKPWCMGLTMAKNRADVETTRPACGCSSTRYAPVINTFPGADTTLHAPQPMQHPRPQPPS